MWFSSSADDDENEKEREMRRREKRANEFRKACRSVWFALLAAKDELFSIDMDDIRSVNDALGTSTYVLDVRKLKSAKREAIAEARQQKTMLAYSDEGDDDDNDDEAREDGEKKRTPKTNVMMMMMMMMMKETRMMTPKIPTAEKTKT